MISTLGGIEWVKVPREETMAAKELSQERDDYGLVPTTHNHKGNPRTLGEHAPAGNSRRNAPNTQESPAVAHHPLAKVGRGSGINRASPG